MVPPSLVVPGPSPRPPHPVGPVRPVRRGPVPSAPEYPRPARPPPWQSVPCPPWTRPLRSPHLGDCSARSDSPPWDVLTSPIGVPRPVLGASPRPHQRHLTPRQMSSTG